MRILYIHQYFCTPAGVGGTRSYEFAKRWVGQGHRVYVISGTGRDKTLPANVEFTIDGITVRTLGVPYRSTMGYARRMWSFIQFALKSVWYTARHTDCDIVLATSTPLTVALPALAARWIAGKPMIFEVRDVWPDAAVDAGAMKNPVLVAVARMLEAMAYNSACHIVPLSTGMRDRICRKGWSESKMTVIPNCSDLDRFGPHVDGAALRREHRAEDKFIILYVGAMNLANDIGCIAEVIRLLRDEEDMEWWFVGGGNRFDFLQQHVKACGAHNVRLFGFQPKDQVPRFCAAADVGLVTFIPTPVFFENSPNKFFDYIAAGLPVIFNRDTWLEPYIQQYRAGWCCRPNHPEEMADRLKRLRDDPALKRQTGHNARRLAEEVFSRDVMAARYIELLAAQASRP